MSTFDFQPNEYTVCFTGNKKRPDVLPQTVRFHSSDPKIDLPSPDFLRLHAVCARVAHMSGAAEVIDAALNDFDDGSILGLKTFQAIQVVLVHDLC